MLHSENLSTLLRQSLTPIQLEDINVGPSSVSLLSPLGQPLCSVFSENATKAIEDGSSMSLDLSQNVKIYSLVLSNDFNDDLSWEILELDNNCYISLNKFKIDDGYLILMMVSDDRFPKKLSKQRLDSLSEVLKNGLKSYKIE